MPSINITDSTAINVNATLQDTSLLGHTPGSVLKFLHDNVVGMLDKPLDQVQLATLPFGFSYQPSLTFAGGSATFTGGAGAGGELEICKPADLLFPEDQFGSKIAMNGNYYVKLGFNLNASASPSGTVGAFTLTLTSNAATTAKLYLPFSKSAQGSFPTLKSSLETLLSSYRLPTSLAEIRGLPLGSVFVFDATGSLGFSASFDVLAAVAPTASVSVSSTAGPFTYTAGPAFTVCGGFTLSAAYEVRLWRRADNTVRLGYYKKLGETFQVGFSAQAEGADVELGSYDLVAQIYKLLGDKGELDSATLKSIPPDAAATVKDAYSNAVMRKLSIELDGEADTTLTTQAAFSWDFDLTSDPANAALLAAVKGKLQPLLDGSPLPQGVTPAGSILDRIRENKRTLTFNFLGLFDHATVHDAVIDLRSGYTEDGQLILTDTIHIKALTSDATPFVNTEKLRKMLFADGAATVAYAASFGHLAPQLTVKYQYFDFKHPAKPSDLAIFVDVAAQIAEKDEAAPWIPLEKAQVPSQTGYLYATLTYDVASATALFLDSHGDPRTQDDYATVLANMLLAMPPGYGLDDHFLKKVQDPGVWRQLLAAGDPQDIFHLLGVPEGGAPPWAGIALTWVLHCASWSSGMHAAGQALQALTGYLQQHPQPAPQNDPGFQALRKGFASQLKNVIDGASTFGNDPSGLLTFLNAGEPKGKTVSISYAGKTVNLP